MSLSRTVQEKLKVAKALSHGECDGTYHEACILMSALISGMAALSWPGGGIDRKRFVELWVRHGPSNSNLISVPLLRNWLNERGLTQDRRLLEAARPGCFGEENLSKILGGADVDMSEDEFTRLGLRVSVVGARGQTYAAVFYRHVRSSLTHEYAVGEGASWWTMTGRDGISYLNTAISGSEPSREIYFPVPWLEEQIQFIATHLESFELPLSQPSRWWVDGG